MQMYIVCLEASPALRSFVASKSGIDTCENLISKLRKRSIRMKPNGDDLAIYMALKRVFREAAESAVRGSNRHQMAVQMEVWMLIFTLRFDLTVAKCALLSLWTANPKLPTLLQPGIQETPSPFPSVLQQDPKSQSIVLPRPPQINVPNSAPPARDMRPLQFSQSETEIFRILELPNSILSQLARASTLATVQALISNYPRYKDTLQLIKAGAGPPQPPAGINIKHTGIPVLLGLQMDGLESGLICNPRSNGLQDYNRETFCISKAKSLLHTGEAPLDQLTTHANQLASYITQRQDEQIDAEVLSARAMAHAAISQAARDNSMALDPSCNPSPALKVSLQGCVPTQVANPAKNGQIFFLKKAHPFYCYFFEQAMALLKVKNNGLVSLIITAQVCVMLVILELPADLSCRHQRRQHW